MTVNELQAALQAALDRGLPGSTTVVIDHIEGEHDWIIAELRGDPSDGKGDFDMWFTLGGTQEADCRFTTGGMPPTD